MMLLDYIVWTLLGTFMLCVTAMTYPVMRNAPAYIVFAWAGVLGSSSIIIIGGVQNWLFYRRFDRYYKW
ncbi:hypothetical protein F-LCD7_0226 [Faustovirus]|nr:hypothetical protein F-LCD7_0226 [Faustovirus]